MVKTLLVILIGMLFFFGQLHAQQYNLQFQKVGIEDGLSSYNVEYVFQDSRGFMWLGTDYGLNRYDGSQVKSYTKEENGLCANFIRFISEDDEGNLWLLCKQPNLDYCVSVFDPISEVFYDLETFLGDSLPYKEAITIAYPFHNGVITFLEQDFLNKSFRYFEYNGERMEYLWSGRDFVQNHAAHLFGGLAKLNDDLYAVEFKRVSDHAISKIYYLNRAGAIIDSISCPENIPLMSSAVGPEGDNKDRIPYTCLGFPQEDGRKQIMTVYDETIKDRKPIMIEGQFTGRVGTDRGELFTLTSDYFSIYEEDGTVLRQIKSNLPLQEGYSYLAKDKDENYWFANQQAFYCLTIVENPIQKELNRTKERIKIRGIAQSPTGSILTGGVAFIQEKINDEWQNKSIFPAPQQIHVDNYLGFLVHENEFWIGGEHFYFLKYNFETKEYKQYFLPQAKNGEQAVLAWMPHRTKDGEIWVGSSRGIHYLDKEQDKLVALDSTGTSKLAKSAVYAFYENEAGTWLSTTSGLFLVDLKAKKVLEHYSSKLKGDNYIPTSHIAHIHEDKEGNFWLATKGDGLIRWNPKDKTYKQYTQKRAGLSHNVLYSVYGDDYGFLWISSQRGLMRFSLNTEGVKIYLMEDGLAENEFNTISHYKGKDGRLYFGGQNGLIHFHPKEMREKVIESPLVITGYYKQNFDSDELVNLTPKILQDATITLSPDDKMFKLNFALLDYRNSKNHLYSYKIEGYDNSWTVQSENEIEINTLPYGRYQLKLRAKGANSSEWTEYPQTISIQVLYPFYMQAWFLILLGLALIGAIYGFFRWRLQRLKQRQEELEGIVQERTAKIEKDKAVIEQQAEELKALDKVKSRFFANISHELRTPLTLILGPLSFILDHPEEWENEEVRRQLLTMQRNGKSLMQLIEEILDLSKLEANKLELQEESTPTRQFFEHIFAVFEPQFQSQELDYEIVFDLEQEELHVLLDRKKLEKVVNNFLSNAIKFTPPQGKITLLVQEDVSNINIQVSDTGKGVHPNDLPHIFERFYQSKQADQKLYGGTGIGLALVSEFATLMGGTVHAESTLGEGSQFYFTIPKKVVEVSNVVLEQSMEELEDDMITAIGTDFTILVVEDNKDMRDFVCQLLERRYTVLQAQNGAEGLKQLRERSQDIDLIVSDVMMPEVDGLTMLKEIKTHPEWNGIPVIMLTALAAERDKLTALTIGVDDYLTKPFSVVELMVRVQNLLYNYKQRQESNKEVLELAPANEVLEDQTKVETENTSIADKEWLKEVEAMVKASLSEQVLDVEGLAGQVFLSSRQLHRKIKSITGLTPAKFIKEVQLQEARKQLESGTVISVTEVAFNNGFEFPATFSTVFKKRFGISPSEYLKNVG